MDSSTPTDPLTELTTTVRKSAFTWLLVRGILGVLLGLVLFFAPAIGGTALAIVVVISLAVWLVVDGVATMALAFQEKKEGLKGWGWALLSGIIALVAGLLAFLFPVSTGAFMGVMFLWFMAFGLIARGVVAFGDRSFGGWSIALGILDILIGVWFAIALFADPAGMVLAMLWVAGIYGVAFGIASIVSAFKVRKATL